MVAGLTTWFFFCQGWLNLEQLDFKRLDKIVHTMLNLSLLTYPVAYPWGFRNFSWSMPQVITEPYRNNHFAFVHPRHLQSRSSSRSSQTRSRQTLAVCMVLCSYNWNLNISKHVSGFRIYSYIYIYSTNFTFMSSIDLKVWDDECLQLFSSCQYVSSLMCIGFMGFSTGLVLNIVLSNRSLAGLLQPCCWLRGWGCQSYGPCLWVGIIAAQMIRSKAQDS